MLGQYCAQQEAEPREQNPEVVADRGEHGVDGVAGAVSEVIASYAVLGLEVANHGLDRSTALELAFDLRCNATLLAGGVDLEPVTGRRIVASISGIGEGQFDGVAYQLLHGRNGGAVRR